MTKDQKADALLKAAKEWQNGKPVCCSDCHNLNTDDTWPGDSLACGTEELEMGASCALSEVAGLGFDIVNADGTPTEKVAEVFRASLTPSPTSHAYGYVMGVRK